MSLRTAIPRDQLRREALLLSKLLQQHADDSLRSREGRTRFLHFIDAHELKTHLRADEPQFLHGFMLDAETAICSSAGRTSMENDVRLKSERILNWLLYEQPDPVVLLPPHAEEIDYEISYLRKEQLMRNLRLVAEAHRQLGAIKGSKMSHELMIKSAERAATGDPQSREELLRFLYQAAPAVAALLDSTRDVVSQRVEHLINHSNVVPLELLDWGALGVTGDLQLRCRALRPSESQIAHWRKVLAASRSNSSSANRVDAEAIAYLCALNQLFRDYKAGVHAVLVTRALTLMHTLNDPNRLYTAASASVRHTRLLWMPEHASDAPALPSGVRTQLSNTLQGLSLSLQNYQRQLGLDTAETVEHVTRDAESLVAAWRQFEGGRFTLGLARTSNDLSQAPQVAESAKNGHVPDLVLAMRRLLEWLRGEPDLEAIVVERLQRDLRVFNRDTYSQHATSASPLPARARWIEGRTRIEVYPIAAFFAGPVLLSRASLGAVDLKEAYGKSSPLFDAAIPSEAVSEDASETYLIWSLRELCNGRSEAAMLYAESAIATARLQRSTPAEREGKLLAAQTLRLWSTARPDDGSPSPSAKKTKEEHSVAMRRLEQADAYLKALQGVADSRFSLEKCALDVERALILHAMHELEGVDLGNLLRSLEQLFDGASNSPLLAIRASELALILCMLGAKAGGTRYAAAEGFRHQTLHWHRRLVGVTSSLRDGSFDVVGAISRLARAVEIIGYPLIARLGAGAEAVPAEDAGAIPSVLMIDVHEVIGALSRCMDGASRFVLRELNAVMRDTRGARDYNLLYAPVWERAHVEEVLRSIADDDLRTIALQANETIHEVGERQRLFAGDDDERHRLEGAIGQFSEVLAHGTELHGELNFYLCAEMLYARLLITRITKEVAARAAALADLAADYARLARGYPASSLMHYRRGIALSELERSDEAFAEFASALELQARDASLQGNAWLRSTIRRRMGYHLSLEARRLLPQLDASPADNVVRDRYLAGMGAAFQVVYDEYMDIDGAEDYRVLIESRRRLNNIVYYASLFALGGGDLSKLHPCFDRVNLERHVRQLHPDGLDQVSEWNVMHTIGTAYHALGIDSLAHDAADLLWHLVSSRTGATAKSPDVQRALEDAVQWKTARASATMPLDFPEEAMREAVKTTAPEEGHDSNP